MPKPHWDCSDLAKRVAECRKALRKTKLYFMRVEKGDDGFLVRKRAELSDMCIVDGVIYLEGDVPPVQKGGS